MLKREDAFTKALTQKKASLEEKQRKRDALIHSLYANEPKLEKLDLAIASEGAKIALTAMSGDHSLLEKIRLKIDKLAAEKNEIIQKASIPEVKYDCVYCKDSGYINGKLCDCIKALAKQITFKQLSTEMPLDECRFDNFNLNFYDNDDDGNTSPRKRMTAIFNLCRTYANEFSPSKSSNLLFLGDAGLGKTHLSLAMVSEIIRKDYDVIYGSAYNLLSMIENERFSSNSGEGYEALISCDLLVIDDLGTEILTSHTVSVLYNVINTRLLSKRPTIINTNLSLAEIEKRYTPRVASRLIGSYTAKKFIGRDIRQIKAMNKV